VPIVTVQGGMEVSPARGEGAFLPNSAAADGPVGDFGTHAVRFSPQTH
jgi:hypothetical protein